MMGFNELNAAIIEWADFKDNLLYYKWPESIVKKNSTIIIRPDQILIIFADGRIEGEFKNQGQYNFLTDIVPKLFSRHNFYQIYPSLEMSAELYFINTKDYFITWETKPKVLIKTPLTPSGIPIGVKGSFQVKYCDYHNFINRLAGVKPSYSLEDIALRIQKEANPIITSAILDGQKTVDINKVVRLKADCGLLESKLSNEFNRKFNMQGLEIVDFTITSFDYPDEINKIADKTTVKAVMEELSAKQEQQV